MSPRPAAIAAFLEASPGQRLPGMATRENEREH
jgi:hypothetical protein